MRRMLAFGILAALIGAGTLPTDAGAQFAPGVKFIGAHVGVSGVGSTAAFGVNGEVAYNDRIGIGAWADTWSYGEDFQSGGTRYDWNIRYIALAGTGSYHFPLKATPRLDPFVGLALGYYMVNTSTDANTGIDYTGSSSRIFLGGFGGARYAFNPNLHGVARLGFGASYLTVGVDFKM